MALATQVPASKQGAVGGPVGVESANATYENEQDLILPFPGCNNFGYSLRGDLTQSHGRSSHSFEPKFKTLSVCNKLVHHWKLTKKILYTEPK